VIFSLENQWRQVGLTLIAFACASFSLAALLLHAAGLLPLYFLVDTLGAPSLILLLVLGIAAHRVREVVFLNRLLVGVWASLLATAAYDLIRLLLWSTGHFHFNPFFSHAVFGRLISGQPENTPTALIVGWSYHFWNGLGLGLMYTLLAGQASWLYAVAWSVFLEIAWLITMPSVIHFKVNAGFIEMSLIGHIAYGVTLGSLAQRFIRS
jgi:hypothetical protein